MCIIHIGHRPEAQEVDRQRGPQVATPEGGTIHPQGQFQISQNSGPRFTRKQNVFKIIFSIVRKGIIFTTKISVVIHKV